MKAEMWKAESRNPKARAFHSAVSYFCFLLRVFAPSLLVRARGADQHSDLMKNSATTAIPTTKPRMPARRSLF